ncbi:MAG: hypothetical protein ACTSVM_04370, partial [Candidatus Ranarchaeia archaeon]
MEDKNLNRDKPPLFHDRVTQSIADLVRYKRLLKQRDLLFKQYNRNRENVKQRFNTDKLEAEVLAIKRDSIKNLPDLIQLTIEQMTQNDIHVTYAKTAEKACSTALEIIGKREIVVQSSTDIPVEIDLDLALLEQGTKLITTETYCRIFQL